VVLGPSISRFCGEWGRKIAMDEDVIRRVTDKWSALGLPGSGKPIWRD